jgi:hypothetical protein
MLAGTPNENMPTSDFMFYYADIFVISVQYGNRVPLCEFAENLKTSEASQEEIFNQMINWGTEKGVLPADYNSLLLASTVINYDSAAR